MRSFWKYKCCTAIVCIAVISLIYEFGFVYHERKPKVHFTQYILSSFPTNLYTQIYTTKRNYIRVTTKYISIERRYAAVTEFIKRMLQNDNVTVALNNIYHKFKVKDEANTNTTLDSEERNQLLFQILNKKNENIFSDVNEHYNFSVLNTTCSNIAKFLTRRSKCILSLENTLCLKQSESNFKNKFSKFKPRKKQKNSRKPSLKLCDFLNVTSLNFLPNTKNPCFAACDGGRDVTRCLPYFMIIGMPKSGTTSLYYHLLQHKDVIPGRKKEPMYFNRACYKGFTFENYLSIFEKPAERIVQDLMESVDQHSALVTGEASADIAFDNWNWREFPENQNLTEPKILLPHYIRRIIPQVKIIILLRNPVERIYSDYLYEASAANYLLSLEDFHQAVLRTRLRHLDCFKYFSIRACAYNSSLESYKARLRVGMYYVFLEDWMKVFPREQILVINSDKFHENKSDVLKKAAIFLDLSKLDILEEMKYLEDHGKENVRSNGTRRLGDMLPETRRILVDFYKPFNANLSRLLKSNAFLWN